MAKIWYGHFDSTPEDERELLAEDWAKYIRMFLSNGVLNGGTNLQITSDGSGMFTRMDEGYANIEGYFIKSEEDFESGRYYRINHPPANPELPRIDRIILRLDRTIGERTILPMVLVGEPSNSPTPPKLLRNKNIYDLSLAQVYLSAGANTISKSSIKDERLDSEVCGIINSLITADTKGMYDDFTEAFKERMLEYRTAFDEQTDRQEIEWQEQTDKQEEKFEAERQDFNNFYNSAKTDIAKLQSFNFDNLAVLPGTNRSTVKNDDGSIIETINKNLDNLLVAERTTTITDSKTVIEVVTVYEEDGETIKTKTSIKTALNDDRTVTEEVLEVVG